MARSEDSQPTLSRRRFLTAAGLLGSGIVIAACAPSSRDDEAVPADPTSPPPSTETVTPPADAYPSPTVLSSKDGFLDASLTVSPALVPFGAGARWALTVNGTTPGPTLRARPGDHLRVVLINDTAHPTNLHTHGLHVSPSGNSDNPFIEVRAGERFTYDFHIPSDHPGGLFWYHPHLHHHVAEQVFAGFYGAIIIEDEFDRSPEIAAADDRLVLIHDARIATSEAAVMGATMFEQMAGREGNVVLVNGAPGPTMEVAAGSLQRWRILNASPSRFYELHLPGHRFHVIGRDGGRLGEVVAADSLLLVPGERIEALVQPVEPGSYTLSTRAVNRGSIGMGMAGPTISPAADILKVSVEGERSAPAALPQAHPSSGGAGAQRRRRDPRGHVQHAGHELPHRWPPLQPRAHGRPRPARHYGRVDYPQRLDDGSPFPPARMAVPCRGPEPGRTANRLEGRSQRAARRLGQDPHTFP
jgi:FtsP/CotA-like multicopper oxidase with cupredoxin domain